MPKGCSYGSQGFFKQKRRTPNKVESSRGSKTSKGKGKHFPCKKKGHWKKKYHEIWRKNKVCIIHQKNKCLELLNSTNSLWIDSRATNHICNSLGVLAKEKAKWWAHVYNYSFWCEHSYAGNGRPYSYSKE